MAVFGCQTSSPRAPHSFACLKLIAWLVMVVAVVDVWLKDTRAVTRAHPDRPSRPVGQNSAGTQRDRHKAMVNAAKRSRVVSKIGASSDAKCHHPHVYDRIRLDGPRVTCHKVRLTLCASMHVHSCLMHGLVNLSAYAGRFCRLTGSMLAESSTQALRSDLTFSILYVF